MFDDIVLPHNSLPELSLEEIDTKTEYLGHTLEFPLMINAMTGGTDFTEGINRDLSLIAKRFSLPMAVGSETVVFEDDEAKDSFLIVRGTLGKEGVVLGNLSGNLSVEHAKKAIDIIQADALQIHLNPAQELAMEEGDRDFRKVSQNIQEAVKEINLPLVVKEVGFGMDGDVVQRLYDMGVRHVDISGFGGTNFFEVENLRCPTVDMEDLYGWGIPTAYSLYQTKSLGLDDLHITASGGIRSALDLTKCLVLGADMCGISGELLSYLIHGGLDYAMNYVEGLIYKTKVLMLLMGAKDLNELSKVKWKATGRLKELIEE